MWSGALLWFFIFFKLNGQIKAELPSNSADWWRDAVYYRLLVDSFKDSDGDGLGDIQGAIKNLGYVRSLGAQAIVISSLIEKSQDCAKPGPLSLDPSHIESRLGSDQDFTALLNKADKLELKVIITLPLETISEGSEWAALSGNNSAGYEDFLVWREGKLDDPPSNIEVENELVISWKWSECRGAYFATNPYGEALLNSCASGVRAAAAGVLVSWLRRGAAGILLQPDFMPQPDCGRALVRDLTRAAADYARNRATNVPVMIVETRLKWREAVQYYAEEAASVTGGAHLVLYRDLVSSKKLPHTAAEFKLMIDRWVDYVPPEMPAIWISGSPFENRVASRYGSGTVDAFNIFALLLPGASVCYQGDELGQIDAVIEGAGALPNCSVTRAHPSNAPIPWDETANGGFSKGTPWLPIPDNFHYSNAKSQFSSNTSHAAIFRAAAEAKQTCGPYSEVRILGSGSLGILRWGGEKGSVLAIANVGTSADEALLTRFPGIPAEYTVAVSSISSIVSQGDKIQAARPIRLGAGDAVILIGGSRHCGGPGPVEKIGSKLNDAVQKINKYFNF